MQFETLKHNARSMARNLFLVFVISSLIAMVAVFVHIMGGTESAFPHMMYLPILLSAYYFSTNGTIIFSAISGFALGPWIPRNVELNLMQVPLSWIFRTVFFIIIGITCSILFQRINRYKQKEIDRSYINFLTGLPNMNKLQVDLAELIYRKQEFSLISFKVKNMNSIMQNISNDIGLSVMKLALDDVRDITGGIVYSFYPNEFAVMLPGMRVDAAYHLGKDFIAKTMEPYVIDRVHVGLLISGGIVSFPLNSVDPDDLIKKMGIALEQATDEANLCVYNDIMDQQSKSQAEMIPQLLNAIKNDEFYLVYQPKLSLNNDEQKSAEALIRWKNGKLGHIEPNRFIRLAEEIGFIGEITKWVIRSVINQSRIWQEAGLSVKIAMNVSPRDLSNIAVIDYYKRIIANEGIDLSMFEIELTERAILGNRDIVISRFNKLRDKGLKISLDDYGVGYNSLINMVQIPTDYIKIDKTFIDHLTEDKSYKMVIRHTLSAAHQTGRKVVAEGVEHEEQLEMLRQMGCDYIQGYYYSKPLLPDVLIKFYRQEDAPNASNDF